MHFHSLVLEEVFRQKGDSRFIDILNAMRRGLLTKEMKDTLQKLSRPITYPDGLEPTELYAIREDVAKSNARRLKQLKGIRYIYSQSDKNVANMDPIRIDKLFNDAATISPSLELCVDCQVMVTRNLPELKLANGTLGRIIGFVSGDRYKEISINAMNRNINENSPEFERMVIAGQAQMETKMRVQTMNSFVKMQANNTIVSISCAGAAFRADSNLENMNSLADIFSTMLPLPIVRFSLDPYGIETYTTAVPPFRYDLILPPSVAERRSNPEVISRTQIP